MNNNFQPQQPEGTAPVNPQNQAPVMNTQVGVDATFNNVNQPAQQPQQPRRMMMSALLQSGKKFAEESINRSDENAKREALKLENTYLTMKKYDTSDNKGTDTIYNFIALPFTESVTGVSFPYRVCHANVNITFDTGEKYNNGTPIKKRYNLSLLDDFESYENNILGGRKILTDDQRNFLKDFQQLFFDVWQYYPTFAKHHKWPADASSDFKSLYAPKISLQYQPSYVLMHSILLSEYLSHPVKGEKSSILLYYSLLHISKKDMVNDFLLLLDKWGANILAQNPSANVDEILSNILEGPTQYNNYTAPYYVSLECDVSPESKLSDNQASPVRIVNMFYDKFNPELFKKQKENAKLIVTPEMLNKVDDLYSRDNLLKVSSFDEKLYSEAYNVLKQGKNWIETFCKSVMVNVPLGQSVPVGDVPQIPPPVNSTSMGLSSNQVPPPVPQPEVANTSVPPVPPPAAPVPPPQVPPVASMGQGQSDGTIEQETTPF